MTMDEVAAEVGIAKASLYKHFPSKEALAAAAMIRLLENTLAFVRGMATDRAPIDQLKNVLQWALEIHEGWLAHSASREHQLARSAAW